MYWAWALKNHMLKLKFAHSSYLKPRKCFTQMLFSRHEAFIGPFNSKEILPEHHSADCQELHQKPLGCLSKLPYKTGLHYQLACLGNLPKCLTLNPGLHSGYNHWEGRTSHCIAGQVFCSEHCWKMRQLPMCLLLGWAGSMLCWCKLEWNIKIVKKF